MNNSQEYNGADFEKREGGYIIGFAGKFYTLWSVSFTEMTDNEDGYRKYWKAVYTYIKNISKNRNTSKILYPGLEVNEDIHGSRSFVRFIGYEDNSDPEFFPSGKYTGMRIRELEDTGYLVYMMENGYVKPKQYQVVKETLESRGYVIEEYQYGYPCCISPEQQEEDLRREQLIDCIRKGNSFEVTFEINIHDNGDGLYLYYVPELQIYLSFDRKDLAEYSYMGNPYYLPIIDGKAKKVKGKTCTISGTFSEECQNIPCLKVKSITINK